MLSKKLAHNYNKKIKPESSFFRISFLIKFSSQLLLWSSFVLYTTNCTRKASEQTTKVTFNFSSEQSASFLTSNSNNSSVQSSAKTNKFNILNNIGILDTTANKPVATNYNEIDCFAVLVGGPESNFKNNSCIGNSTNPVGNFDFGFLVGMIGKNEIATLEIPSGKDRFIKLVGVRKPVDKLDIACPNILNKTNESSNLDGFSKGYVLGEVGMLDLQPGATLDVNIPVKYEIDQTAYVEDCYGELLGPKKSPGNSVSGPYVNVNVKNSAYNSVSNQQIMTKDVCYPVDIGLYVGNGLTYTSTSDTQVDLSLNGIGSFYADSSCAGLLSSNKVILAGTSKTNENELYFKPTVLGVKNLNLLVQNNSESIGTSNTYWNIGNKKIRFIGPDKNIAGSQAQCIKYTVNAVKFEGGVIPNQTDFYANLNNNGPIYNGPNCDSYNPPFLSGYGNNIKSASVYVRLNNSTPGNQIELKDFFSTSEVGFDVDSFKITAVGGSNIPDSIDFKFEDGGLSLNNGECKPFKIRLVNSQGGPVIAKTLFTLNAQIIPQGRAMIFSYYDANCSTSPQDLENLYIFSGEYESGVLFLKTYGMGYAASPNLTLKIDGSGLKLINTSGPVDSLVNISVTKNPDPYFIDTLPRSFSQAEVVGSHEFDEPYNYLYFPLIVGNGTSYECSIDGGNSYSEANCGGNIQNGYYKMSAAEATNSTNSVFIKAKYPNGDRILKMNPQNFYGAKFKFIACNQTAGSGAGQTISLVNSNLSASSHTLCLEKNTTYSKSATESFNISASSYIKRIIGYSDMSSILDATFQANPLIQISGDLTNLADEVLIANLTLARVNSSTQSAISINSPLAIRTTALNFSRILFEHTADATSSNAIYVNGATDPDITTNISSIKCRLYNSADSCINLNNSSNVNIKNSYAELRDNNSIGIQITSPNNSIENITISRLYTQGVGTPLFLNLANSLSNFKLSSSYIKIGKTDLIEPIAQDSLSSNAAIKINGPIYLFSIMDNFIANMTGQQTQSLVYYYDASGLSYGKISNNVFFQANSGIPVIKNLSSSASVSIDDFEKNHFVYAGVSLNSAYILEGLFTNSIYISSNLAPSSKYNLVCHSSIFPWSGLANSNINNSSGIIINQTQGISSFGRCVTE